MNSIKRNSTDIQNEKENMDIIKESVEKIMQEKINHHPCDFICRRIGLLYPETNHEVLEIPGEFKNVENTAGFTLKGETLYMDGLESVFSDEDSLLDEYAACIEYLTTPINPKKENMFKYNLSIIITLGKFCYNIIVTHKKPESEEITYYIDGHPLHIIFRVFDKQRIYKILNTLMEKDYTNQEMSEEDVVLFSYGIAFAKDDYAKDYLEKSVNLFSTLENVKIKYQKSIFLALKEKIKYYFTDDKKKKRELITMMITSVSDPGYLELSDIEKMEVLVYEREKIIKDKDKVIEGKNKEIEMLKKQLSMKNK